MTKHRPVRKVSNVLCRVAQFSVWLLAGRPGKWGFIPSMGRRVFSATVLPGSLPFLCSPGTEVFK